MKVLKNNQHGNSEIFSGSRKEILKKLRNEAHEIRLSSRKKHNLEQNVHSINKHMHPSNLVTMASFEIKNKNLNQLLELLSNYGICNYVLK